MKHVDVQNYRDPTTPYRTPYPEKRDCYRELEEYLQAEHQQKVCALFGLRRTGKTVLMQQCIENMSESDRRNTLLLTCQHGSDIYDILAFLEQKVQENYRYFFIDEITYADGFQAVGEALANHYVALNNSRIVITGTDSLGLSLPSHNLQYDRSIFIKTTYLSFPEYARLTGCQSLDEYIRSGGLLTPDIFSDYAATHEYIDTSIADNIIHSLEHSEGISKYPAPLSELYEYNELKNAIERIVNGYSQHMTLKAIRKEFRSTPVFTAINNITRARENPENIREYLDYETINHNIAHALGVLRNEELSVHLTEEHKQELYSFLQEVDVFVRIPVYDALHGKELQPIEMISHPGMFHANLTHALSELQKQDNWYPDATPEQKTRLISNAYESAVGEIMENIIIHDTHQILCGDKKTTPDNFLGLDETDWYVSKLTITINGKTHESDMLIANKKERSVYLFEIKHSDKSGPEQSIHLEDEEFLDYIRNHFGEIRGRAVLYSGDSDRATEVPRLSAKNFLNTLYTANKSSCLTMSEVLTYATMTRTQIKDLHAKLYDPDNSLPLNDRNRIYDAIHSVIAALDHNDIQPQQKQAQISKEH